MHCPNLADLPFPPSGRNTWPWTEECSQLPETMPNGKPWPRFSIITPSYNQGQFIEETIRSVLLQGYPNLEYIIMDGGSKDNSLEVIKKYDPWLSYWESKADRGQSHAINKGWERCTGEITAWLKSDDVYRPEAFQLVAQIFQKNPEAVIVIGACAITDIHLNVVGCKSPKYLILEDLLHGGGVPGQPSVFLKSQLVKEIGYLDENLHYVLDWEYWLRFGMRYKIEQTTLLNVVLSSARQYDENKSSVGVARALRARVQKNSVERRSVLDRMYANSNLSMSVKRLRAIAYSCTYWQQANFELQANHAPAARRSFHEARKLAPELYDSRSCLIFLIKSHLGFTRARFFRRAAKFVIKKTGLASLIRLVISRKRLVKVPIEELRCQMSPFQEIQGYSGRSIDHFPPCKFYRLSLNEPEMAYIAFCDWLREILIEKHAWKIHRSEGGWSNGSLVQAIFRFHKERGIELVDFTQADPAIINETIEWKAKYYLDLFNSIRKNGFVKTTYPPIYCNSKDDHYFIHDGHHRVSAMRALHYEEVDIVLTDYSDN